MAKKITTIEGWNTAVWSDEGGFAQLWLEVLKMLWIPLLNYQLRKCWIYF
jgi:hypothetical protein